MLRGEVVFLNFKNYTKYTSEKKSLYGHVQLTLQRCMLLLCCELVMYQLNHKHESIIYLAYLNIVSVLQCVCLHCRQYSRKRNTYHGVSCITTFVFSNMLSRFTIPHIFFCLVFDFARFFCLVFDFALFSCLVIDSARFLLSGSRFPTFSSVWF